MIPHLETLLVLVVVPSLGAASTVAFCSSRWELPAWGLIGVGIAGWVAGFLIAAGCGTVIAAIAGRDRSNAETFGSGEGDRPKES